MSSRYSTFEPQGGAAAKLARPFAYRAKTASFALARRDGVLIHLARRAHGIRVMFKLRLPFIYHSLAVHLDLRREAALNTHRYAVIKLIC